MKLPQHFHTPAAMMPVRSDFPMLKWQMHAVICGVDSCLAQEMVVQAKGLRTAFDNSTTGLGQSPSITDAGHKKPHLHKMSFGPLLKQHLASKHSTNKKNVSIGDVTSATCVHCSIAASI